MAEKNYFEEIFEQIKRENKQVEKMENVTAVVVFFFLVFIFLVSLWFLVYAIN